ncbi:MAG: hypothetical protein ACF8LK_06485 [Phycisphaerales bacterium JB041]
MGLQRRTRGDAAFRFLGKFLGGVTPEMRLSPEVFEELDERAKGSLGAGGCLASLAAASLLTVGLTMLRLRVAGTAANPVLDSVGRVAPFASLLCAVIIVLVPGVWFEQLAQRRRLGVDEQTWIAYHATKHGWTPRRSLASMTVMGSILFAVGWVGAWNLPERVDEKGIMFSHNMLAQRLHTYDEVTAIEHFAAVDAPIGILQKPNIIVRFSDGSEWRYYPEPSARPVPREVAEYVSERAGVPIAELGIRPR